MYKFVFFWKHLKLSIWKASVQTLLASKVTVLGTGCFLFKWTINNAWSALLYRELPSDLGFSSLITSYSFYRLIRCWHIPSLEDHMKICRMSRQDTCLYPLLLHSLVSSPVEPGLFGADTRIPTRYSFPLETFTLKTTFHAHLDQILSQEERDVSNPWKSTSLAISPTPSLTNSPTFMNILRI